MLCLRQASVCLLGITLGTLARKEDREAVLDIPRGGSAISNCYTVKASVKWKLSLVLAEGFSNTGK